MKSSLTLAPVITRTADAATGVNFDPDSFIDTIQNMLGQSVARQPSPGSESECTLSGDEKDDLSISSEESVTSDPGECVTSDPGECVTSISHNVH